VLLSEISRAYRGRVILMWGVVRPGVIVEWRAFANEHKPF